MFESVTFVEVNFLPGKCLDLGNAHVFETFFVLCSETTSVIHTSRLVLKIFNLLGDLILSKVITAAHGDLHTSVLYTML